MEDKIWRLIYSSLATFMFLLIFVGAYYAGKQGWYWMGFIFIPVAFITVFSLVAPHKD